MKTQLKPLCRKQSGKLSDRPCGFYKGHGGACEFDKEHATGDAAWDQWRHLRLCAMSRRCGYYGTARSGLPRNKTGFVLDRQSGAYRKGAASG